MILWTIKHYKEWETLLRDGIFRADPEHVDEWFRYAYSWYIRCMEELISRPTGVETPVWAWYQYLDKSRPCPDLRHIRTTYSAGKTMVRVTLEVPDESVLLSDFDTWHYALNRWYLPRSEKADQLFDAELAAAGLKIPLSENDLPDRLCTQMEKSWETIFDLAFDWKDVTSPPDEKQIQATMWEMRLEWVVKMEMFTGTGKVYDTLRFDRDWKGQT